MIRYFIFCFKQSKIKFLSCIFPKKYTFLLMFIRSRSRPYFFNAAPAPLKKGGSYQVRLPSPDFYAFNQKNVFIQENDSAFATFFTLLLLFHENILDSGSSNPWATSFICILGTFTHSASVSITLLTFYMKSLHGPSRVW